MTIFQPQTIPPLRKKTPAERGLIDADSLAAALKWDKIMDPEIPAPTTPAALAKAATPPQEKSNVIDG